MARASGSNQALSNTGRTGRRPSRGRQAPEGIPINALVGVDHAVGVEQGFGPPAGSPPGRAPRPRGIARARSRASSGAARRPVRSSRMSGRAPRRKAGDRRAAGQRLRDHEPERLFPAGRDERHAGAAEPPSTAQAARDARDRSTPEPRRGAISSVPIRGMDALGPAKRRGRPGHAGRIDGEMESLLRERSARSRRHIPSAPRGRPEREGVEVDAVIDDPCAGHDLAPLLRQRPRHGQDRHRRIPLAHAVDEGVEGRRVQNRHHRRGEIPARPQRQDVEGIVVHDVEAAGRDLRHDRQIGRAFDGVVAAVARRVADADEAEARIRPAGREERDVVASPLQPRRQEMGVQFQSARERLRDRELQMGYDRDLHRAANSTLRTERVRACTPGRRPFGNLSRFRPVHGAPINFPGASALRAP